MHVRNNSKRIGSGWFNIMKQNYICDNIVVSSPWFEEICVHKRILILWHSLPPLVRSIPFFPVLLLWKMPSYIKQLNEMAIAISSKARATCSFNRALSALIPGSQFRYYFVIKLHLNILFSHELNAVSRCSHSFPLPCSLALHFNYSIVKIGK